jgi:cytochrome c
MKRKLIGVSIAALSASSSAFLLNAAPPADTGPRIDITAPADGSHIAWNSQVPYAVTATYDGKSTKFGELPANDVVLRATYVADADAPLVRHAADLPEALVQISQSNCTGCHDFTGSSAGPSFSAISKRYAGKANAIAALAGNIRNGSHGSWGSGTMPPHPDLSAAEASAIAQWIVSLGDNPAVHYSVGKNGSFRMQSAGKPGPRSGVALTAFYTGPLKPGDSRTGTGHRLVVIYGS